MGLDVGRVVVEGSKFAKTNHRREFQKLLAYCHENSGRIFCVGVNSVSRFARSVADPATVQVLLHGYGSPFYS